MKKDSGGWVKDLRNRVGESMSRVVMSPVKRRKRKMFRRKMIRPIVVRPRVG